MSTLLQKKLARNIVETMREGKPRKKKELIVSAGYSAAIAEGSPNRTMEQKGVKEELRVLGFDPESAMKVVQEVMHGSETPPAVKILAADKVFKVHGSYAPEKKEIRGTVSLSSILSEAGEDKVMEGLLEDGD